MKILAFTGNRADYYLQRPLLRRINKDPKFKLKIIVSGAILGDSDSTVSRDMQKDNLEIGKKIQLDQFPNNHSYAISIVIKEASQYIELFKPDLCIIYADRFESFGFSVAAFHSNTPSLHIEAGDITNGGTYDDNLRHCITKMSHLFCSSTEKGLGVIRNLGEESWRAIHSGLLSYDDMKKRNSTDQKKIIEELNLGNKPVIICTMHPIPNNLEKTLKDTSELFAALRKLSDIKQINLIVTAPNNDYGGKEIRNFIKENIENIKQARFIDTLGGYRYQSILSLADNRPVILCGNSSSIVKEAPFFNVHGLNIGLRQLNRESATSQINCEGEKNQIFSHLNKLVDEKCKVEFNPYYVENSCQLIIEFIKDVFNAKEKSEILNKKWNEQ